MFKYKQRCGIETKPDDSRPCPIVSECDVTSGESNKTTDWPKYLSNTVFDDPWLLVHTSFIAIGVINNG